MTAEVTAVFGDALQAYLTKKVASMEELFMQQLEVFVSIIADSQTSSSSSGGDSMGGIDELSAGSKNAADGLPPGGDLLSQIALEKVG